MDNNAGFINSAFAFALALPLAFVLKNVKTQFKSLREKFLRERKAYESRCRSGAALEDLPTWEWYKEMNYLDDYIQRRKTCTNIKRRQTDIVGECSKSLKIDNSSSDSFSVVLESDSENTHSEVCSNTIEITDHDYEVAEIEATDISSLRAKNKKYDKY
ncbi:hypothetical protein NQ318_018245 [Aromia moschata]|uniref:MADF domain-containing protein n=1 Tax=Aromia moschata TaxID=1265417 RepID=A0AAV8ZEY8_9CUCU|nr:hypothetical protein NQ318_018245 [Aromia moschata]